MSMEIVSPRDKKAYLIVTDLHLWGSNIRGRFDYKAEVKHAVDNIISVADKYKIRGYTVIIIFLGDLFHMSYNEMFEGISSNNLIIYLRTRVDSMYSLLGNHELSFYKDNPFWTLVAQLESDRIKSSIKKMWQPRGVIHVMSVVDELIDGNVRFLFNHYGCPVMSPPNDGKVNIGLFHLDLYAKALVEDVERNKGVKIFEHNPVYFDGSSEVLYGYDYAFLGHMHMMYGKWIYQSDITGYETKLYYLASLGRTDHRQVNNLMLERNIPAVLVEDGNFVQVEDNLFNLMRREDCVDEAKVELAQEKREEQNELKEMRKYVPYSDDPIENIRISLTSSPALKQLFEQVLSTGRLPLIGEIEKRLEELR